MEEEIEIRREDRLEAWGRDDFSVYKPHKVLQVQEGEEVQMEVRHSHMQWIDFSQVTCLGLV